MDRSTACSSRGPGFGCQCPHGGSHLSVTAAPVPGDLALFYGFLQYQTLIGSI